MTQALVLRADSLGVETLQLEPPGPYEVRVRMLASGVCHTDLEVARAAIEMPRPIVLGHEGCGIVTEVGDRVDHIPLGQRVALHWNPACRACSACRRGVPLACERCGIAAAAGTLPGGARRWVDRAGEPVHHFMFLSTFASEAIVMADSVVAVPDSVASEVAALVGCAGATGIAAVWQHLDDTVDTVAVIGCGVVGLAAVMAAAQTGRRVIATDHQAERRRLAAMLGADVVLDPAVEQVDVEIRGETAGSGACLVIEAAGAASAMRSALESVRPGGRVVLLGKLRTDDQLELRWGSMMGSKTLVRHAYGGAQPANDFPKIFAACEMGQLPLDQLVSSRIRLEEVPAALDAIEVGRELRPVVVW